MSFKLNSIFLCGMCIFPIFISGIPLIDDFKQFPAIDAADDQISETLREKIASDDSQNGIKNGQNLHENHDFQQTATGNTFSNFKEDIFVDVQPERSDEQGSVSDHRYSSRTVDDDGEDYTEVPIFGFDWKKPSASKERKSHVNEFEPGVSEIVSTEATKPKRKRKIHGGRKSYSFDDVDTSAKRNAISKEIFGDKLFLFKKNQNIDPTSSSTMKDAGGENSLFLFDDQLPNPSEKLNTKNSFYR